MVGEPGVGGSMMILGFASRFLRFFGAAGLVAAFLVTFLLVTFRFLATFLVTFFFFDFAILRPKNQTVSNPHQRQYDPPVSVPYAPENPTSIAAEA